MSQLSSEMSAKIAKLELEIVKILGLVVCYLFICFVIYSFAIYLCVCYLFICYLFKFAIQQILFTILDQNDTNCQSWRSEDRNSERQDSSIFKNSFRSNFLNH